MTNKCHFLPRESSTHTNETPDGLWRDRARDVDSCSMRHRFWKRVLAGVSGLWVLFVLSGVAPVHGCGFQKPDHGMASGAGASMHHMHHGAPGHSHAPTECHCIGICCPATHVSSLPSTPIALAVTAAVVIRHAVPPAPVERRAPVSDVVLPPPLGPPSILG